MFGLTISRYGKLASLWGRHPVKTFTVLQSVDKGTTQELPTFFVVLGFFLVKMLLYCAVGELVPTESIKLGDAVYKKIEWYTFPPNLRRHFLMMIRQTQQPFNLMGLRLLAWECSVENFTNVISNTSRPFVKSSESCFPLSSFQLIKFSFSLLAFLKSFI